MMAGEVDMRFSGQLAVLPHIRAGRVRPLGVASVAKSAVLPNVPTLASIYPGFEADNWYAMFIAAGTPKDIVTKLNAEVVKVLKAPDMRDAITKDGAEPVGSSPEELGAYFRREIDKYAKVIKAANVQLE
jgi:tripartite-type tricarboxylate transporter receptor subunit TctC